MLPTLRTERLVLRPLAPEDARDAHRFLSDERVMRYWSSGPHADLAETAAYIAGNCTGGAHESWAVNLCERRPDVYETGYILSAEYWGRGLAREAIAAALDHVFGPRGARRVFADTDPDNAASIALLERLGFTREGLLREEWRTHLGIRDTLILGLLASEWDALT